MNRTVIRKAPAKINLGLDVTGVRSDGYHLLETVFQTVSVYDMVTVSLTEQPGIVLTCDMPGVPCDAKNIAWKAAQRFCEMAGIFQGVVIHLEKHIPAEAGMGGGSTDGAAVLLALQELTDHPLSMEQLSAIAVSLGADVPFFLYGGTAYAEGVGEILEPLPFLAAKHLVIAKGTAGVSTAAAYGGIDRLEQPVHPPVQQLKTVLQQGAALQEIAACCGNLFEMAVSLPEVDEIRRVMLENGAWASVMTGSGAAVFGIFESQAKAEKTAAALASVAPFVCLAETVES